ncbi:MAG: two-component system response regulator [Spirochaetales bacterium]|nr:two-component system response regulator [Spirochaetales bacterium]
MNNSGNKHRILIVDDDSANIAILTNILKSDYIINFSLSGKKALDIIGSKVNPDLILLDIVMPEMDGYDVCAKLKENKETRDIPIIFITSKTETEDETKGFEYGAVDFLTKPVNPAVVKARVKTHIELKTSRERLKNQNQILEQKVKERTKELHETRLEIIRNLGRASEYKDKETGTHVIRMSKICRVLAIALGLDEDKVELIMNAAPMHDVGKIGIPDSILLKPGKLDNDEWEIMKTHTVIGAKIIGDHPSPLLQAAKLTALYHHEKWNGEGYPTNKKGKEIPEFARIVAIADVFDALTSPRPYKNTWTIDEAVSYIKEEKGKHFDPQLVDCFMHALSEIKEIKEKYADA